MARRCTAIFLITCLVVPGVDLPAIAQSTYGSILGTVHDASGAAIQGAQVTLTNVGTAATRMEVTDAAGNYAFRNIDVGVYKIAIIARGFQAQTMPEIG